MKGCEPYKENLQEKKQQVAGMFDSIASHYDFLNHFLSAGIDRCWRKKAIRMLKPFEPSEILDIATGTGDFAIAALKVAPKKITGIDLSEKMLCIGREKIRRKNLSGKIILEYGDAEKLQFPPQSFDAVTVAFGVRNFSEPEKGLREMFRVLRSGKPVIILEFSNPTAFPVKQLFGAYFRKLVPFLGRIFSKSKTAYRYLYDSARAFPSGKEFCKLMEKCGFSEARAVPVSGGIATIYFGIK
jgi:demethylmenaquinone methyltransferase/2-methoxy-6-polyprenyl-1,4-benzoquinol methylase